MKNVFKITSLTGILNLLMFTASACPTCERQQPKVLRGIVHGVGPQGNMDYIIIIVSIILVLITFWFSLQYLIRPGEKSEVHIKRLFLN